MQISRTYLSTRVLISLDVSRMRSFISTIQPLEWWTWFALWWPSSSPEIVTNGRTLADPLTPSLTPPIRLMTINCVVDNGVRVPFSFAWPNTLLTLSLCTPSGTSHTALRDSGSRVLTPGSWTGVGTCKSWVGRSSKSPLFVSVAFVLRGGLLRHFTQDKLPPISKYAYHKEESCSQFLQMNRWNSHAEIIMPNGLCCSSFLSWQEWKQLPFKAVTEHNLTAKYARYIFDCWWSPGATYTMLQVETNYGQMLTDSGKLFIIGEWNMKNWSSDC